MRGPWTVIFAVLALAGCDKGEPRTSESNRPQSARYAQPDDHPPKTQDTTQETMMNTGGVILLGGIESIFFAHVTKAEAIFIGKLVESGEPPGYFSGYNIATQRLTYEVIRVVRGQVDQPTMTVHQLIVARSPVLDGDQPRLKPEFVEIGAEYIVAVNGHSEGKRLTYNENMAPIKATPANLARLDEVLGQ